MDTKGNMLGANAKMKMTLMDANLLATPSISGNFHLFLLTEYPADLVGVSQMLSSLLARIKGAQRWLP